MFALVLLCNRTLQLPVRQTSVLIAFGYICNHFTQANLIFVTFMRTYLINGNRREDPSVSFLQKSPRPCSAQPFCLCASVLWESSPLRHTGTSLNYGGATNVYAGQAGIMRQKGRNAGREDMELEKVEMSPSWKRFNISRMFIWAEDWTIFLKTAVKPHLYSEKLLIRCSRASSFFLTEVRAAWRRKGLK